MTRYHAANWEWEQISQLFERLRPMPFVECLVYGSAGMFFQKFIADISVNSEIKKRNLLHVLHIE